MKICQVCGRDTSINWNNKKIAIEGSFADLVFSVNSVNLWGPCVYCKNCVIKIAHRVLDIELKYKK